MMEPIEAKKSFTHNFPGCHHIAWYSTSDKFVLAGSNPSEKSLSFRTITVPGFNYSPTTDRIDIPTNVPDSVRDIDLSPDDSTLAVSTTDGKLYFVDMNKKFHIQVDPRVGTISQLTWSPDGTRIAAKSSQHVLIINTSGGMWQIMCGGSYSGDDLSWSPDSKYISYTDNDFAVCVVNSYTLEMTIRLGCMPKYVWSSPTTIITMDKFAIIDILKEKILTECKTHHFNVGRPLIELDGKSILMKIEDEHHQEYIRRISAVDGSTLREYKLVQPDVSYMSRSFFISKDRKWCITNLVHNNSLSEICMYKLTN